MGTEVTKDFTKTMIIIEEVDNAHVIMFSRPYL